MAKAERKKPVKIVNPRYKGAKPEDVGRALLRRSIAEMGKAAVPKTKRK